MFLMIGNCSPHSTPSAIIAAPAPISHKVFCQVGCHIRSTATTSASTEMS